MQQSHAHPIGGKWPAQFPQRLQLYSLPTPNGIKVSVMLEEVGLPYEAHRVDIQAGDQFTPEFLALNPNNKIPALWDPNGPDGQPLGLFESGAILIYLAEKSGQFLPQNPAQRYETLQWLMWQMGGAGPMFGQVGFFWRYGGKYFEDKRPLQRYVAEAKRLLGVLDARLQGRDWILGADYTIADIAVLPWVRCLSVNYEADALLGLADYANVQRVLQAWLARPAVQRGLGVPAAAAA
ncbi:glutathione S-transferase N-terminal domain-containing protein [Comamonas aquatica]|uniref:glutathione S-transferase N-terminal domain-containing protein n=1 Tax=Comamonas aquatica TaxID=225991 RepID=UPI002447EBC1|nr:glutathione S-transferase N-terminal domain-containing protein [Comamonas aquatica]MDH0370946.1 glutathione S-transferase N-terminal domain-containing protein [Comamonas aquatica]